MVKKNFASTKKHVVRSLCRLPFVRVFATLFKFVLAISVFEESPKGQFSVGLERGEKGETVLPLPL